MGLETFLKEKSGVCNARNSFLPTSMVGDRSTFAGKENGGGSGKGTMSQSPGKGAFGRRRLCFNALLYP